MVQINALTDNRLDGHLGIHVLVAEDNVINQLILRDQLEDLGCTVELAGFVQAAMAGAAQAIEQTQVFGL